MLYPLLPLPQWDGGGGQEEKTYHTILYESNRYGFARAYYDSKTVELYSTELHQMRLTRQVRAALLHRETSIER